MDGAKDLTAFESPQMQLKPNYFEIVILSEREARVEGPREISRRPYRLNRSNRNVVLRSRSAQR
jgi:hypothetical protein